MGGFWLSLTVSGTFMSPLGQNGSPVFQLAQEKVMISDKSVRNDVCLYIMIDKDQ